MRWLILLAVTLPPIVLAAIGVTHPVRLTPESAGWWTTMHIILVPIFPLLGVAQWLLVRGRHDPLSWGVRIAAFGYLTFYGVLDALAGIGTGTLTGHGLDPGAGGHTGGRDPAIGWIFDVGNEVGTWGAWAFLAGSVLLAIGYWRRHGRRALPGGVLLVVASYSFVGAHIYWPVGVLSMLAIGAGFALLTVAGWQPAAEAGND